MRHQYFIISSYFHHISMIFPYMSNFLCQVWPQKQRLTCCGHAHGRAAVEFPGGPELRWARHALGGLWRGPSPQQTLCQVGGGLVISVWVWICLDELMSNPQKDGTDQIHSKSSLYFNWILLFQLFSDCYNMSNELLGGSMLDDVWCNNLRVSHWMSPAVLITDSNFEKIRIIREYCFAPGHQLQWNPNVCTIRLHIMRRSTVD